MAMGVSKSLYSAVNTKSEEIMKQMIDLLKTIDDNVVITHENQIEIDKRLERIENKLGIKPYNPTKDETVIEVNHNNS